MARCTSCGSQLPDYYKSCPNCGGTQLESEAAAPQFQPQHAYVPRSMQRVSLTGGQWFGWLFLCNLLPIIGPIIMLNVVKDPSAKNFAKMMIVFSIIGLVLSLLIYVPALIGYLNKASEMRVYYGMMTPFMF